MTSPNNTQNDTSKTELELRAMLEATYMPEITDLELNEHQGVDRPVVYLDNAVKVALRVIAQREQAARIDELETLRGVVYGISSDGTIAEVLQHIDVILDQLQATKPDKGKDKE